MLEKSGDKIYKIQQGISRYHTCQRVKFDGGVCGFEVFSRGYVYLIAKFSGGYAKIILLGVITLIANIHVKFLNKL